MVTEQMTEQIIHIILYEHEQFKFKEENAEEICKSISIGNMAKLKA